jgi:flagellar hook-length control protein FliK
VTRSTRNAATAETPATDTATAGPRATERGASGSGAQFATKLAETEGDEAPVGKQMPSSEHAHVAATPLPATDTPRPAAHAASAAPATTAAAAEPTLSARHGEIGQALGVEVARKIGEGGEELRVRLNPAEFGRVEVKIAFDDGGTLRATVHAENPAALDLLRRDSADLNQALGDAGVRADAQSFRFESRTDGQQRQQQQAARQPDQSSGATNFTDEPVVDAALAAYRPMRTPGRVDLLA